MWAILPIKLFSRAKTRLAALLDENERASLARAMADDVLGSLCGAPGIECVYVVTAEPAAEALAGTHGALCLPEGDSGLGLNGAVGRAFLRLAAEGAESLVVVHSDLPLLSRAEIRSVCLEHARGGGKSVCVVPDRRREGTNLLALRPPAFMRPQYGAQSFANHCAQARSFGAAVGVCELAGGGLDIDLPEDVEALLADRGDGARAAKAFLRNAGIPERIARSPVRRPAVSRGLALAAGEG